MKRNPTPTITQIAEVVRGGALDITKTGKLSVQLLGTKRHTEIVTAHALMPFGGRGHGIFGPVEPFTKVLVTPVYNDPWDSKGGITWYWIGVIPEIDIVRKGDHEDTDDNKLNADYRSTIPDADRMYDLDEVPTKTVLKNMIGHKLELAETAYTDTNKEVVQEDYAMLTTNSAKYIKLDSGVGKQMDRIIITDEKDNRIVIKTGDDGDADPGWGPESITVECTGNMHLLSKTGEMDIRVGPDSTSNITIQNEGTGDIVCQCDLGSTYILAEKDILVESTNLRATHTESIYLQASANVSVSALDDINTQAHGNTTMLTDLDLKIDTEGTTTIDSKLKTIINCEEDIDITSQGQIKIDATGPLILKGSTIDLN
tara:strand:- start:16261 stop:17373 length:1113 start_codon:yes stop_codon:yes gene_type:complete